jgi:hypothetical protein
MPSLMLAMLSPVPGREEEFNTWYDDVHAAEALATPGLISITRYRMGSTQIFPGCEIDTSYLTIYEVDGDTEEDFERVATSLRTFFLGGDSTDGRHISEIMFTDLIDMTAVHAGFAVEVSPRRTEESLLGQP